MSDTVRARLLLARMDGDTEPSIVAAIDETIWEHWEESDASTWLKAGKRTWGDLRDTTFRIVAAEFSPGELRAAFETPTVTGRVSVDASASRAGGFVAPEVLLAREHAIPPIAAKERGA